MASQSTSTHKFKSLFRRTTPQPPESSNNAGATTSPRKMDVLKSFFLPKTSQPSRPPTPIPPQLSNDNLVPTALNILDTSPPPPSPIPAQSSNDNDAPTAPNATDIASFPVVPRKSFVKSKIFEKDIAVLSIAYTIEGNPELKKLIPLIVEINDKDEDDELTDVLETCARFSVQLASATEAHSAETKEAINEFIKTVEKINTRHDLEDNELSLDALTHMVDDEITIIKSSHPLFVHSPDIGTSDRLSKVLTAAISGGITVLSIAKDASAVIPVPWVQGVIGGVINLLNAVGQTRSNYEDMRQIAATAGDFVISCAVICSDQEPSKELKRALNKFTKKLEHIAKECHDMSQLNPCWRYFQQNDQKNTLQGIRTSLDNAIKLFETESQVHMQLDIERISRKLDDATLNSLPSHPRYEPAEYLARSRDDVLQYISGWIDKRNEAILWIHGAAGLGKSTTGQQLVHLLKEDGRLAGAVFLTNLTKQHPEIVIQIIARQLGEKHPRAIANIAEAARKFNDPHGRLRDYFMAYIIDPIRRLEYPYQLVVVIDALDEWTSHESFLAELAHISSPSPVKFVLTSRPSYSIERILNKFAVQRYPLPPVSQEIIERYFHHHFETFNWRGRKPDEQTISRLAAHAQGLLIWAATVCSVLSHEFDQRYPHRILEQILQSEEKVGARSGEQLERLYRDAVTTLFPDPDMQEKLRGFLGAMMVLQGPLPVREFARLLPWETSGQVSDRPAEEIQRRLAAFQTRGEFKSDTVPPAIQQFHFSFLEFMESTSTEYNGQPITINTANAHSMLANRCLSVVFSEFLQSYQGKTCAYSELRGAELYAIKYWPLHLSNGSPRLPLPAPSIAKAPIDMISEEDMRRWARLFLPCVAPRFRDGRGYDSLDNTARFALLYELAMIIGNEDVTTLLYQLYCLEIAVRLQPTDVGTWRALGNAHNRLYEHGRNIKSVDEEVDVLRHALELVSRQSAGKGALNVAGVDVARNSGGGSASGIDVQGYILFELGTALLTRFEQRGASSESDLDEAISFHLEALPLRPAPHPLRSGSLNNLANALLTRFEQRGASSDLDEAISFYREALPLRPAPHPERSGSLINLANALLTRFEQRGASSDLDEAISFHREALPLCPAPHLDRSASLNNLANALLARFQQRGASSDLDEAISFLREALPLCPAPHPDRSGSLNNFASALLTRFEQRGASSDLDEAISLYREALLLHPAPHPLRSASLNNLANALLTRFEQRSASSDLDEAISFLREALPLCPAPHPVRSASLNNLANALLACFEQWGVSSDLDEAIAFYRGALLLRPAPHPDRPQSLGNLAHALQSRFGQLDDINDLDEAILLWREVLVLYPAPHRYRSWALTQLADALHIRFEKLGTTSDRDEANSLRREAEML